MASSACVSFCLSCCAHASLALQRAYCLLPIAHCLESSVPFRCSPAGPRWLADVEHEKCGCWPLHCHALDESEARRQHESDPGVAGTSWPRSQLHHHGDQLCVAPSPSGATWRGPVGVGGPAVAVQATPLREDGDKARMKEINARPSGMTLGGRRIAVPRLQLHIANKHVSPSLAAMEKHAAPARPANLTAQSATLGLVPLSHDPRLRLGALHLKLTQTTSSLSRSFARPTLLCLARPPLRLRPRPSPSMPTPAHSLLPPSLPRSLPGTDSRNRRAC